MLRASWLLALFVGGFGFAYASDPAPGGSVKSKYHVVNHDHSSREVDLSKAEDAEWVKHQLEHGHIHEIAKIPDAPTLGKLASLRFDLGIWTLVIFLLLLYILSKMAWPKMITGLQRREANIRGALDEAHKTRDEAQQLRSALQKDMDQSHQKVKEIIDEAKRDAQVAADEITNKARSEMAAERDRLRREIQTETDQALQSLWTKAADLATQLSSSALKRQLDLPAHRRLIDEALHDIQATRSNGHAS